MRLGYLWACLFLGASLLKADTHPLDVVLLIDASTSMEKYDPGKGRDAITDAIVQELRKTSHETSQEVRLAVAWFGETLGPTKELRPLSEIGSLNNGQLPFTDFVPPLDFALGQFQRVPQARYRHRQVILLTDGFPQKRGQPSTFETDRTTSFSPDGPIAVRLRRLASMNVRITVIGIGTKARLYEQLWEDLVGPNGFVVTNSPPTPNELLRVAEILIPPGYQSIDSLQKREDSGRDAREVTGPLAIAFSLGFLAFGMAGFAVRAIVSRQKSDYLIKEGQNLLRKGEAEKGRDKLLEAVRALDDAAVDESLIKIARYKSAFTGIFDPGFSDRDQRLAVLRRQIRVDLKHDKGEALADALRRCWAATPELFFPEFYLIQASEGGARLIDLVANSPTSYSENRDSDASIVALAQASSLLTRGASEPIARDILLALTDYRRALEVTQFSSHTANALRRFYQDLGELVESPPSQGELSLPDETIKELPSPLRDIANQAKSVFRRGLDNYEAEPGLSAFIRRTNSLWPHSPEALLLQRQATSWLQYLSSYASPPTLRLFLQPSLDLRFHEEQSALGETAARPHPIPLRIPFLIRNDGGSTARSLRLKISSEGVELKSWTRCSATLPGTGAVDSPSSLVDLDSLAPHQPLLLILEGTRTGPGTVTAQLVSAESDSPTEQSLSLRITYPSPKEGNTSFNPFVPDGPLYPSTHWSTHFPGEHALIAQRIRAELEENGITFIVLRGVRRTGKTTLLSYLAHLLRETAAFVPVYIDLYNWHLVLTEKGEPIDHTGLFYELADAALQELFQDDTEKLDTFLQSSSETMRLDGSLFANLIQQAEAATSRKVLYLIDELDWWIGRDDFNANSFLAAVAGLTRQKRLRAVLSHDWTTPEWQVLYTDEELMPRPFRVEFLDEPALRELADAAPFSLTDPAKAFLWLVTGGWEGLAQLILYNICRDERPRIVTSGEVKDCVASLIRSQDWEAFLTYLLRSLSPPELVALRTLIDTNQVDASTGELRGIRAVAGETFTGGGDFDLARSEGLKGLYIKQIIQSNGKEPSRLRLRVGIFSYQGVLDLGEQ